MGNFMPLLKVDKMGIIKGHTGSMFIENLKCSGVFSFQLGC